MNASVLRHCQLDRPRRSQRRHRHLHPQLLASLQHWHPLCRVRDKVLNTLRQRRPITRPIPPDRHFICKLWPIQIARQHCFQLAIASHWLHRPAPGTGKRRHRPGFRHGMMRHILRQPARIHRQLQREIPSPQRHVRIVLRRPHPHSGTRLAFIQILPRNAQRQRSLHHQQYHRSPSPVHAATSAICPTSRRRVFSSAHPPARNSTPSTISPSDRSSLPMMSEK